MPWRKALPRAIASRLNYRPPRVGRNPKSGDKVHVPAKYVPHFKAGKELRERVDFKSQ